jgi:hypothetical protein
MWTNNMIKNEQNIKTLIFKMKEKNVKFKEITWQMKSPWRIEGVEEDNWSLGNYIKKMDKDTIPL